MSNRSVETLVICPCGKAKVWDRRPDAGSTVAREVYTGTFFRLNREYAERVGDAWVILSAKYGFVSPDFGIPGPYDTTFNKKSTNPIDVEALVLQRRDLRLDGFGRIVVLGGRRYRKMAEDVFSETGCTLEFPFSGCSGIGDMQGALRRAIDALDT